MLRRVSRVFVAVCGILCTRRISARWNTRRISAAECLVKGPHAGRRTAGLTENLTAPNYIQRAIAPSTAKPPARRPRVAGSSCNSNRIGAFAKIPTLKGIVMKDAFHGSAHPAHGLVTASRGSTLTLVHPYRGSTPTSRRRGTARTAPVWIRRAGAHCADRLPRIVLEVDAAWAAIPCWSGRASRWAHSTVHDGLRPALRHPRPAGDAATTRSA